MKKGRGWLWYGMDSLLVFDTAQSHFLVMLTSVGTTSDQLIGPLPASDRGTPTTEDASLLTARSGEAM